MKFILALLLASPLAFADSHLSKCNWELQGMTATGQFLARDHFGGFATSGGLTTLETSALFTPEVESEIKFQFLKIRSPMRDGTYPPYTLMSDSDDDNLLADFLRAHAKFALAAIQKTHPDFHLEASTVILTDQSLQDNFHNHLSEDFSVKRGEWAWAALSMNGEGTIFRNLTRTQIYQSTSGETGLFNTETEHRSPHSAHQRLFLIHFFTRVQPK